MIALSSLTCCDAGGWSVTDLENLFDKQELKLRYKAYI